MSVYFISNVIYITNITARVNPARRVLAHTSPLHPHYLASARTASVDKNDAPTQRGAFGEKTSRTHDILTLSRHFTLVHISHFGTSKRITWITLAIFSP